MRFLDYQSYSDKSKLVGVSSLKFFGVRPPIPIGRRRIGNGWEDHFKKIEIHVQHNLFGDKPAELDLHFRVTDKEVNQGVR